jgi:hypothetical protein
MKGAAGLSFLSIKNPASYISAANQDTLMAWTEGSHKTRRL